MQEGKFIAPNAIVSIERTNKRARKAEKRGMFLPSPLSKLKGQIGYKASSQPASE